MPPQRISILGEKEEEEEEEEDSLACLPCLRRGGRGYRIEPDM